MSPEAPRITVVMPCCNPPRAPLEAVLAALRRQTLPREQWELLVVDDASREPLTGTLDLAWHPAARTVATDERREGLGLVGARLRGFELGRGSVFVFVDQDNALHPDYLEKVFAIHREWPRLGTWGGQIFLKFEDPTKIPPRLLQGELCTRELGADLWSNDIQHHASTPWGAGFCARREVLELHRNRVLAQPMRRLLDPTPRRAGFGGDTDIAYTGCEHGYGKGVFAGLRLDHLIPPGRCTEAYLLRSLENKGYSSVLHGFVTEGRVRAPRTDWRHFLMTALRAPRTPALARKAERAQRRGGFRAVRELETQRAELEAYARVLHERAVALSGRRP